jgi:hypothetical protein
VKTIEKAYATIQATRSQGDAVVMVKAGESPESTETITCNNK